MFTVLWAFITWYAIGWVLGFLDGLTAGKIRWVIPFLIIGFYFFLVAKMGFIFGTLLFILLVALTIRWIIKTVIGAFYGVMSLFRF